MKTFLDTTEDGRNNIRCQLINLLRHFNRDLIYILKGSYDLKRCAVYLMKLDEKKSRKHFSQDPGKALNICRQLTIAFPKKYNTSKKCPTTGIVNPFKSGNKDGDKKVTKKALVHVHADVHTDVPMMVDSNTHMSASEANSPAESSMIVTRSVNAKSTNLSKTSSSLPYQLLSDSDEDIIVDCPCDVVSVQSQPSFLEMDNSQQYSGIRKKSITKNSIADMVDFHSPNSAADDEFQSFHACAQQFRPFKSTLSRTSKLKQTSAKKWVVPLSDISMLLNAVTKMKNSCLCTKKGLGTITISASNQSRIMIMSLAKRCHFPIFANDDSGISLSKTRRSRVPSATDIEWAVIAK